MFQQMSYETTKVPVLQIHTVARLCFFINQVPIWWGVFSPNPCGRTICLCSSWHTKCLCGFKSTWSRNMFPVQIEETDRRYTSKPIRSCDNVSSGWKLVAAQPENFKSVLVCDNVFCHSYCGGYARSSFKSIRSWASVSQCARQTRQLFIPSPYGRATLFLPRFVSIAFLSLLQIHMVIQLVSNCQYRIYY